VQLVVEHAVRLDQRDAEIGKLVAGVAVDVLAAIDGVADHDVAGGIDGWAEVGQGGVDGVGAGDRRPGVGVRRLVAGLLQPEAAGGGCQLPLGEHPVPVEEALGAEGDHGGHGQGSGDQPEP